MSRSRSLSRVPARIGMLLLVVAMLTLVACGGQGSKDAPKAARLQHPHETTPPKQTRITLAPPEVTAPKRQHPNLLVIETDDMRSDDLRWMPNVRRLVQRKGLTFENSFAPYPLCCPSRASFMSGLYAHNHHVYSSLRPFGFGAFDDRRTIATVLQAAGYHTGLIGKYLNGYGRQRVHGTTQPSLHYVPPGWDEWMGASDHKWKPGAPYAGSTYNYYNLVQNVNGKIVGSPGHYSTDVLAGQTRTLIDQFGRQSAPWFLWWTPVAPHHGKPEEPDDPGTTVSSDGHPVLWDTPARPDWVKGRFDSEITHGAGTPLHGSAEPDVSDKPDYLRMLPELTAAERRAETTVTRQRAETLFVLDIQIGRTLSELSRTGQMANTLIVFTSDNGYYLGEHRKRQGKINLHEPSLRVPLIIAGPGVPHGTRYDPVTTVDLAPTLAAYAGTQMPAADGQSLQALVTEGDHGWDRPVVTEGTMPYGRYPVEHQLGPTPLNTRGLRLGRWKLTRYSTGEVELYDLARDPLELHSLGRVRKYAPVLADMMRLYRQYSDCSQKACVARLPKKYRVSAAESRRITRHQVRATRAYYNR